MGEVREPGRPPLRIRATATRAARQAASAVSAPIRAAFASRPSRSRSAPIELAAACSRSAVAFASRASALIRLISVSQSRAAASSPSGVVAAATADRKPPWASSLAWWTARGSARQAAVTAAASCSSYCRWAARSASLAVAASALARVASSHRSSATCRSSMHRSVAAGCWTGAPPVGGSSRATVVMRPDGGALHLAISGIRRERAEDRVTAGGDRQSDRLAACAIRGTDPFGGRDHDRRKRAPRSRWRRSRVDANVRSAIELSRRCRTIGMTPVCRSAPGRFRSGADERVVGEGHGASRDGLMGDREADHPGRRRSSTKDLDQGRTAHDTERKAQRQEAEFACRHAITPFASPDPWVPPVHGCHAAAA